MLKSPPMVISERRPGTTDVITRVQPRIIPEKTINMATTQATQVFPKTETLLCEPGDFLDFHNPIIESEAESFGWEHGRVFTDPNLYGFFKKAQADGILEDLKQEMDPQRWERDIKITSYFLLTDARWSHISPIVGYKDSKSSGDEFRSFVQKVIAKGNYDIPSLNFNKPRSTRYKETVSRAKGGQRQEAKELLLQGVTDYREIAIKLNISEKTAAGLIRKFRKEKIMKESTKSKSKKVIQLAREAQDDIDYAHALRLASRSTILSSSDIFMSIGTILRNAKIRWNPHTYNNFIRHLETAKIPFKKLEVGNKSRKGKEVTRYGYYVLKQQEEQIVSLLLPLVALKQPLIVDNAEAAM